MKNEQFFIIWKKNINNGQIGYFIENFITENLEITLEVIEKIFSQNIGRNLETDGQQIGIFKSEEEINRFSFHLGEELDLKEVTLVSLEMFNNIIEKQFTKEKLLLEMHTLGEKINNPEFNKKNVFKRIFT